MRIVLDVENTTIKKHNKLHLDPFEKTNELLDKHVPLKKMTKK